jgi:2-phosphosulfolactate phosphatase
MFNSLSIFYYHCANFFMDIRILHLVEGARKAAGITVVIDVFRAFSLAAYAFNAGAETIIPVSEIDTALSLKKDNPDYILVGERNENKIPGFDFGNSPSHLLNADLKGKTLVHTTSAGTQGLVNAMHAPVVLTGSFVNASAIVRYIKKLNPGVVSLVCMGYAAEYPVEEDSFCAEYIKNELMGIQSDFDEYKKIIRQTSGQRFFEKEKQHFAPSTDFDLCLQLNRFNFVLKASSEGYLIRLNRVVI